MLILFTSCLRQNSSPYLKDLKSYNGELANHFPRTNKGLTGFSSLLPDSNSYFVHRGKYIKATFIFDKVQEYLKYNEFSQYFPDDSCQFIISGLSELIIKNECSCQTLPIPDFILELHKYKLLGEDIDIEDVDYSKLKLPADFEYYVDAKKGVFIEDKFFLENLDLPDCWEHGYSRGFAISKKRNMVIIWLEMW